MSWEPKVVGFLCNWCSYRGADLAGTGRIKYAPNVRIIRVMCSARVEPAFILKAFQAGADGVLVLGCHPGDCHYMEGNYKAMRRIPLLKKMLVQMGIEEDRVRLDWVSASEGERFAATVNDMTEKVRALGPLSRKYIEDGEVRVLLSSVSEGENVGSEIKEDAEKVGAVVS